MHSWRRNIWWMHWRTWHQWWNRCHSSRKWCYVQEGLHHIIHIHTWTSPLYYMFKTFATQTFFSFITIHGVPKVRACTPSFPSLSTHYNKMQCIMYLPSINNIMHYRMIQDNLPHVHFISCFVLFHAIWLLFSSYKNVLYNNIPTICFFSYLQPFMSFEFICNWYQNLFSTKSNILLDPLHWCYHHLHGYLCILFYLSLSLMVHCHPFLLNTYL